MPRPSPINSVWDSGDTLLSYSCWPSWYPTAWSIRLGRHSDSTPSAFRIDRLLLHRVPTLLPSIPMAAGDASALLEQARQVTIPLGPSFYHGLDGCTYHFAIGEDSDAISLSWWGKLPDAWKVLQPVLDRLESLARIEDFGIPPGP